MLGFKVRRRVLSTCALGLVTAAALASPSAAQISTFATGVSGVKDMVWDASGQMYATGQGGGLGIVYKIGPNGSPVTQFNTTFVDPWGLAVSPAGELYVADRGNPSVANSGRIYKLAADGTKTVFATNLSDPMFIHFASNGDLFVGEWGARKLLRITPAGVVTTYASDIGGPGEEVGDFVFKPSGDIYIGAGPNIKILAPGGSPVSVFATGLNDVVGMLELPFGAFMFTRYSARDIWYVSPAGVGSKWSGSGGCGDGSLATAGFSYTAGIRMHDDVVYIAASGCNMVKVVDFITPAQRSSWGRVKTLYR